MYLGPDSSNLYALPIFDVSTGFKSDEIYFSILFSISLEIFSPSSLKILIPLSKKKSGKSGIFDVVGPVCESTDTFLKNYLVEGAETGDFLAFLDVGAYGAVLSSEYNTRPLVPEIMVYNKRYELVRSRPTYEEIFEREVMPNWE